MDNISQKDIDWLLNDPLSDTGSGKSAPGLQRTQKKNSFLRSLCKWIFGLLAMVVVPFFLLLRLSVYLNVQQNWNGWTSLAAGGMVTILLLLFVIVWVFRKSENKKRVFKIGGYLSGAMVAGYCLYALLYLSSVHAKTDQVREVYRSLHPILRVAVATTTLADPDLVITDILREPEDYTRMGLSIKQSSLHYRQSSGYVHAIDLRTIGQSEIRNKSLEWALRALGLKIIRHVGTADHLHVALPSRE